MASMTPRPCAKPTSAFLLDTAVDVAKETADIILLEKSLLVLGQGIVEGRRTFVQRHQV